MNITDDILNKWNNNRLINPLTKRSIKLNGPTYNKFLKKFNESNKISNLVSYNYTKNDINKIIKIQKIIRHNYLIKISGPAYINPLLCNNDKDIISLDNIWTENNNNKVVNLEFDKELLFTYRINKLIYGLNIRSLEELFKKIYKDPFTNLKFSSNLINKITTKIQFINKIIKKPNVEKYNYNQIINSKIINIIKIMEFNDIYLNIEWFKKFKKILILNYIMNYNM